jgi:predicted nucleic acid-binding protein
VDAVARHFLQHQDFDQTGAKVDEAVLVRWRNLAAEARRDGDTYPQPGVLLAATALVLDLGVATSDGEDFVRAGCGSSIRDKECFSDSPRLDLSLE